MKPLPYNFRQLNIYRHHVVWISSILKHASEHNPPKSRTDCHGACGRWCRCGRRMKLKVFRCSKYPLVICYIAKHGPYIWSTCSNQVIFNGYVKNYKRVAQVHWKYHQKRWGKHSQWIQLYHPLHNSSPFQLNLHGWCLNSLFWSVWVGTHPALPWNTEQIWLNSRKPIEDDRNCLDDHHYHTCNIVYICILYYMYSYLYSYLNSYYIQI